MKKIIFIFALIFFIQSNVFAQRHGAYVGTGLDLTIAGNLYGFQAGVELNRHRIGFLHEQRFKYQANKYSTPYQFNALVYEFDFFRDKHINIGLLLRAGFVNDQFLVIVPAISVDYIFNDYWKINMVSGIRVEKPAIAFNLFFNLPFKKNEFEEYQKKHYSHH